MDIETTHGLITGLVDAAEAVRTNWASRRDQLDVVKVIDPDRSWWPTLQRAGFRIHPAWITWVAPVGDSESAFLTRLSRNERATIRSGQRSVAAGGIEFRVTTPVTAAAFDAFLALYDQQIATMLHGIPFARLERETILAVAGDYFTVEALVGRRLVGCCVCRIRRDISTVVIRFASCAPDGRQQQVVRAMYMKVFDTVRRLDYPTISLGSDPALYGHIAQPGLFAFKSRLRFTPVPARLLGSIDDPDEASLVLRLGALTEPSLLLNYQVDSLPSDGTAPLTLDVPLALDVLTATTDLDVSSYRAPFLVGLRVRQIPCIRSIATASVP